METRLAKVIFETTYTQDEKTYTCRNWKLMKIQKDEPIEDEDVKWFLLCLDKDATLISWWEVNIDDEHMKSLYITYLDSQEFDPKWGESIYFQSKYIKFPFELGVNDVTIREVMRVLYDDFASYIIGWSVPVEIES